MTDSKNRVAVVTGGAEGIGAAICRSLAQNGADVAIWDRNKDGAQRIADEIIAMGCKAVACEVDVSNKTQIESAVKLVRQELGPVGIIVNNAGISPEKDFVDITEEEWDTVMNINLKGTFFCTQAVIGDMIASKWGRIINISSSSAQTGASRMVHYSATKGGVIAFTKSLAQEVGSLGITVNNIPPSFIYAGTLKSVEDRLEGGVEGYANSMIPVKRVGQPEDIGNAVAFLASEASGYITGLTLSVNGGRYMQ